MWTFLNVRLALAALIAISGCAAALAAAGADTAARSSQVSSATKTTSAPAAAAHKAGETSPVSAPVKTYGSKGAPITLEQAKKVAAPALAEAAKNNWNMAVAIVDPSGNLVYYEKMDATQLGSANLAVEKARNGSPFQAPIENFSGCPGRRR